MEVFVIVALSIVIQLIILIVGLRQYKLYKQETKQMVDQISEQLLNSLNPIQETLEKNILNINNNMADLKNEFANNMHTIMKQIGNLQLANYIDFANEIHKSKDYTYEDENFIQDVGHCKIVKIKDKKSGEVTHVYYDHQGNKSHTETFTNEILKYSMMYDNKKLVKGFEYNLDGDVIFKYEYNEAGEIINKTEYLYSPDRVLEKTLETIY